MNKEILKQGIETMKARLASMEAELNKPVSGTIFIPKDGKRYYFLNQSGDVCFIYYEHNTSHKLMFDLGNIFNTKEEVEKARDKQLAYVRVTRKLRELEGNWVADWSYVEQDKYRITYQNLSGLFNIEVNAYIIETDRAMYSTKEACQWVMDNMADDLKLIFEVE